MAMERALRRAGPALLASGCTVIAAMLVLLLVGGRLDEGARARSRRSASRACCWPGVTLLPALLTIAGAPRLLARARGPSRTGRERGARSRRAASGGASATACCSGPGSRSARRSAMFAFFSLGLLTYKEDYSIGGFFKTEVESLDRLRGDGATSSPRACCRRRSSVVPRGRRADEVAPSGRAGRRGRRASVGRADAAPTTAAGADRHRVPRRPVRRGGARARRHPPRAIARHRARCSARAARCRRTSTAPRSATCA